MQYTAQNFSHLLGTPGFTDAMLELHFKLYEGYVANTNKLMDKLSSMEKGTPEYAELKRRFGWEWNGIRLHELYFGNLSKEGSTPSDKVTALIEKHFGSMDQWKQDFAATGAMRGIGWVVLAYDEAGDNLFNLWINEHDLGHLAGATPLLIMDVFEHAFITEYGTNRADYIQAFMNAINWKEVEKRLG